MRFGLFASFWLWVLPSALIAPAAAKCVHVAVTAADTGQPLVGIEDIALDRTGGVAFLSSDERRRVADEIAADAPTLTQGGIYALPLAAVAALPAHAAAVALTRGFKGDFHPHGIDLWLGSGGDTLFAVNHRARPTPAETVEVFDLSNGALVHRTTLQSDLITSPNDLAAAGRNAFFVTNDHGATGTLGRTLEDVTGNGRGSVVRYDGDTAPGARFSRVATGISYANGIAFDRKEQRLYVAASRAEAVQVYDIANGGLPRAAPDRTIPLGIGVDNLDLAPDGSLTVAGHPSLWRFALYALTGDWRLGLHTAPSRVARLDPGPPARVKTLYADDGHQLSAATVGVAANGLLLVGAVFAPGLVTCRLQGIRTGRGSGGGSRTRRSCRTGPGARRRG